MRTRTEATIEDLYQVPDHGKAELIQGEIVRMSPTGGVPGRAAGEIYVSLRDYVHQVSEKYEAQTISTGFV